MKAKEINKFKKKGKKMLPRNFTVSEGHGHPLVINNLSMVNLTIVGLTLVSLTMIISLT